MQSPAMLANSCGLEITIGPFLAFENLVAISELKKPQTPLCVVTLPFRDLQTCSQVCKTIKEQLLINEIILDPTPQTNLPAIAYTHAHLTSCVHFSVFGYGKIIQRLVNSKCILVSRLCHKTCSASRKCHCHSLLYLTLWLQNL